MFRQQQTQPQIIYSKTAIKITRQQTKLTVLSVFTAN